MNIKPNGETSNKILGERGIKDVLEVKFKYEVVANDTEWLKLAVIGRTEDSLWSINFFKALASHWGSFVMVDDNTPYRRSLDFVKVLVKGPSKLIIPSIATVEVNGFKFRISISMEDDEVKLPKEADSSCKESKGQAERRNEKTGGATEFGDLMKSAVALTIRRIWRGPIGKSQNILRNGEKPVEEANCIMGADCWAIEIYNKDRAHVDSWFSGVGIGPQHANSVDLIQFNPDVNVQNNIGKGKI
ncbi:hypothetical protein PTKIN_Ptkin12aG0195200 [Pterospermum kingtungense]